MVVCNGGDGCAVNVYLTLFLNKPLHISIASTPIHYHRQHTSTTVHLVDNRSTPSTNINKYHRHQKSAPKCSSHIIPTSALPMASLEEHNVHDDPNSEEDESVSASVDEEASESDGHEAHNGTVQQESSGKSKKARGLGWIVVQHCDGGVADESTPHIEEEKAQEKDWGWRR